MQGKVDEEKDTAAAGQMAGLRMALSEGLEIGDRLARAYRLLDRVARKASPSRCDALAPQVTQLERAIGELTAGMTSVRHWTLNVTHFLETWHPIGPPYPPPLDLPNGGDRSSLFR
ncbi:MAG: hypothetical protein ACRDKW_08515 [Actinomycetota bacterium]